MTEPNSFLARMARASTVRVVAARHSESESALLARATQAPRPPALRLAGFDLIAELKRRSPALGPLETQNFSATEQLAAYADGGAAAVSVLTEPDAFGGSLADLTTAAHALAPHAIPVMRKDFLTDPYQVLEARAAGAGGVLVIVTMLSDPQITALLECALACGLFVLLEAFDRTDLERIGALTACACGTLLCGVNSRNLKTLEVEFDRFAELAPYLPGHLPAVAESGIARSSDIERVARLGYRAALVGGALMQAASPAKTAREWLARGRACAPGATQCS